MLAQHPAQPASQRRLVGQRAPHQRGRNQGAEPRHPPRAPFQSLGMGHRVRVVVDPPKVAREHPRDAVEAVLRVLLFDLVAERAQQLDG